MNDKIFVPAFAVDNDTLQAGLYLRESRRLGLFSGYKVWDLRFYTNTDKFMTPGTMHTIEHAFAYKLREHFGKKYISLSSYACGAGFELITTNAISYKAVRELLIEAIEELIPIVDKSELPSMNTKTCARPTLYNLQGATSALSHYHSILLSESYL